MARTDGNNSGEVFYLKSAEIWQGHGKKIQSTLRSIKNGVKEEGWLLKGASYQTICNTIFGDKTKRGKNGTVVLMHKIEDEVEDPAIAPTKYGMVQGVDNAVIEDPNPPQIIFHKVCDLHYNMERKIYTDQTGKFLFKSYIGMHAVHHSFI